MNAVRLNSLPLTMDAFEFPEHIPPFPPNPQPWSANETAAHQVLENAYIRALQTIRAEDSDPLRYKLLSSNIIDNMIPILEGLQTTVPRDWIDDCVNIFGPLVYELQVSALAAEGMQVTTIFSSNICLTILQRAG